MTDCVAFTGETLLARGPAPEVARAAKQAADRGLSVLAFDARTSRPMELDLRGDPDVAARRAAEMFPAEGAEQTPPAPPRGPGRPKLGVVAREVTLLPRHWEWLAAQPGGASAALRRLVESARKDGAGGVAAAQDSLWRFATAMAGNAPGFEEAMRAFTVNDRAGFLALTQDWPADIRDHARVLADAAFVAG